MSPRDATKNIDPHSKRIIFDAAEWQERLERLAEMRKEARAERASAHAASAHRAN
jgi:hypothetical protein